jgi:hypothetical protein
MKCFKCDGSYQKRHGKFKFDDRYVGVIIVDGVDYFECQKCGDELLPAETAKLIENKRKELLERYLEEQPIKEFLSAAETAASLNISRQALHKHQRIKKGFIYQTTLGGNKVYLKRSIDLYKERGDGRFPINVALEQRYADIKTAYAGMGKWYSVQAGALSIDYGETFPAKIGKSEWSFVIQGKKRGQGETVKRNEIDDMKNIGEWSKWYVKKKRASSYLQ